VKESVMKNRYRKYVVVPLVLMLMVCLAITAGSAFAADPSFKADLPMAITSSGQSLDAYTLSLVCKRVKLDHAFNNTLKSDELTGIKTLIIVMGGSAKGLGEAGIDEKGELQRVGSLLSKAKEQKIKVIAVHLGGESRKGALSDKFIDPVVAKADFLILTEDGNKGGVFTNMAKAKKIPILVVKKSVDVGGVLKGVSAAK
jgi:hypothetical protein